MIGSRKLARYAAHIKQLIEQGHNGDWSLRLHQPAVEVLAVYSVPDTELLAGSSLDIQPARFSAFTIPLAGWVVAREGTVKSVKVVYNEHEISSAPLDVPRPDVSQHLEHAGAENSGFRLNFKTLGLEPRFTLELYAVLDDQRRALLGRLECRQAALHPAYQPKLNPIIVTFLGRSGSTWLMRLLSEHPQIVVDQRYPYETRPLLYWMHLLRVLSAPADHQRSTYPIWFTDNEYWIGQNPFNTPESFTDEGLLYWLGQKSTAQLASLCLLNVDQFYRHLKRQQKKHAVYFAEKALYSITSELAGQLYPKPRQIILVRDPRDIFASVQSFNAKRGTPGFRVNEYTTPEAYLQFLKRAATTQARVHRTHPDQKYLLRYEDLILRPQEMMAAVFQYLNLDSSPQTVAGILERASQDTPEMQHHRTTSNPGNSIGRWRRDLSPEMQATATTLLGGILTELGYPIT
jgi:hypothetical protein